MATSTVKSHIVSVLQDFVTQSLPIAQPDQVESIDVQRIRDHNQQIIMETAQTMINIQHQFCVASYDSFSPLMCCFMCSAPVGFPHDSECGMLATAAVTPTATSHQPYPPRPSDGRSQTSSPHFPMNFSKTERDLYHHHPHHPHHHQQQQHHHHHRAVVPPGDPSRGMMYGGAGTVQSSSAEHGISAGGAMTHMMDARGASPHHEIRGPSPIQGFLDNVRGPLPNPGHLLGMKTPFYRGSRSPLNFPLFPLNGQRRWSEAAAGEVKVSESSILDAESHMRRWSMPWEASSKTVKNTVSWHQTKIMPISKLAVPISKSGSDHSQSTTPGMRVFV